MPGSVTVASDEKKESKIITKDLLETAIRSKEGDGDLEVKHFELEAGSMSGDNFASVVFSIKVTSTDKNGKERVHNLFLKTAHDNEVAREWTFVKSKVFLKEGKTYSVIIPDMIRYQKDIGIEPFGPSVPPFYHSVAENYKGIIILEDIRPRGYVLADKISGLDNEHCEVVMRKLADFHALSYALKNRNPDNLKKYDFLFHDSLFSASAPKYFTNALEISVNIIKTATADPNIKEHANKILTLDFNETVKNLLKVKEPFSVICHGDMWCNNILFKYNDKAKRQEPLDVKLVDLQIVRYAPLSTDLVYFFCTSTTRDTRKKYMRNLLHTYHSAFMESLEKLNLDFPEFTFDVLQHLVEESMLYGVLMACVILPMILTNPSHRALEHAGGKSEAELRVIREQYLKQFPEITEKVPAVKERLLGVLEDAVEMGML